MVRELRAGDCGADVIDLRERLGHLGFTIDSGCDEFDPSVDRAVREFQESRGLECDGRCGAQTWKALIEAGYRLGDRLIVRTAPMMRGDDVAELQLRLGSLGFDAGRVDGIFGDASQRALGEFQRNVGIVCDFVCGPVTAEHLVRLATRGGSVSVAGLRERETLKTASLHLISTRIAVCHLDDDVLLAGAIGSTLHHAGAAVAVFAGGEWAQLATLSNNFDAQICIGITTRRETSYRCSYFATNGFVSFGGRHLAELIVAELPVLGPLARPSAQPMRLPLLRETRASAVMLDVGAATRVVDAQSLLAAAVQRAVVSWIAQPV